MHLTQQQEEWRVSLTAEETAFTQEYESCPLPRGHHPVNARSFQVSSEKMLVRGLSPADHDCSR